MKRTARQPGQWLTMGGGVLAALVWSSLAVRALVMDHDPSTRALFVCAALVLAGFGLGSATWVLTAARRARRSADAEMEAPFAILGILLVGIGANPILDRSTSAWDWAFLVAASLVGGLNLSFAYLGIADRAAASAGTHSGRSDLSS